MNVKLAQGALQNVRILLHGPLLRVGLGLREFRFASQGLGLVYHVGYKKGASGKVDFNETPRHPGFLVLLLVP